MAEPITGTSPYIYGLHDPGGEYLMEQAGTKGWIVFTHALGHDPDDRTSFDYRQWADREFGIIARLNHGYPPDGTIPHSSQCDNFAQRVGQFVDGSHGAHTWVIGNEMNSALERPGANVVQSKAESSAEVITPERYAECYTNCRQAIHSLSGHEDDQVVIGAVAPWNNNTVYPGNETGDWVQYLQDILTLLGPRECDGIALHTYTHGRDLALISGDQFMDPPFDRYRFNFRAYIDFMEAVPADMRHLPVYITETDQDEPWLDEDNSRWVQSAYQEIDNWNKVPGKQVIRALVLYRWPKGDRWGIEGKGNVIKDFEQAMAKGYRWDTAEEPAASRAKVGSREGASNDEVAEEDQLNFRHYVRAFADLIASEDTTPPLTIGIFGSWGMGKSFLLQHIKGELEGRKKPESRKLPVHIVEFNAWEYSANDAIWPGLVRKIMQTLEKEICKDLWNAKFRDRVWRNFKSKLRQERAAWFAFGIAAVVVAGLVALAAWQYGDGFTALWSALGVLGASGLLGLVKEVHGVISEPLSPWITALFEEDSGYGKPIDYMSKIREDLELLGKGLGDARVLVLIDDLDRCEPDKAVEVLQAIKLLLNFEEFVVCMGIDARVITRAVEQHYKGLLGPAKASGYEYLDKIIQIPFRIPEPSADEIEEFISKQMMPTPAPPEEEPGTGETLYASPSPEGPSSPPAVQPQPGTTVDPELASDLTPDQQPASDYVTLAQPQVDQAPPVAFESDELDAFQNLARFLRRNPRHIKRLINVYRLVRSLATIKRQQFILDNPAVTIRWLIICAQWPYTAYAMLHHYDEMLEDRAEGKLSEWPPEDPLLYLLTQVRGRLVPDTRNRLDHDPDLLDQLLALQDQRLTWDQLQIVRYYTINFNPAVEAELPSGEPEPTTNTQGDGANTSQADPQAPPAQALQEKGWKNLE